MNARLKYRNDTRSFTAFTTIAVLLLLMVAQLPMLSAFSTSHISLKFPQPQKVTSVTYSPLDFAAHAHSMSTTDDNQDNNNNNNNRLSIRKRLRQITGFSLTAFRATMRAATGISLTALYASAFAATSAFVRKIMTVLLAPLPAWFRYFLQPFLILYYAPLFILRNLTGPTGKRAKETHTLFVDGFRTAVDAAEKKADGYWPVHVNEDGDIIHVKQSANEKEYDITEGVAESVEVVMEDSRNNSDKDTQ